MSNRHRDPAIINPKSITKKDGDLDLVSLTGDALSAVREVVKRTAGALARNRSTMHPDAIHSHELLNRLARQIEPHLVNLSVEAETRAPIIDPPDPETARDPRDFRIA